MKILNIFYLAIAGLLVVGCESTYENPHDFTAKGAFVRWDTEVESINFVMDLTTSDNPVFTAPVTAPGGNVVSYDLSFSLVSVDGTFGPFQTSTSVTNFPANLSISADELKAASGLSDEEFGGQLRFVATVTNTDGDVYVGTNDFSGDLFNPGQRHAHTFTINLVCPSDLAGTYNATASGQSTDGCCPNPTVDLMTEVVITEVEGQPAGTYTISDISAGLYFEWYDVYNVTGPIPSPFTDACGILGGTTAGPFGGSPRIVSGSISADGNTITYRWQNGFGDRKSVV